MRYLPLFFDRFPERIWARFGGQQEKVMRLFEALISASFAAPNGGFVSN